MSFLTGKRLKDRQNKVDVHRRDRGVHGEKYTSILIIPEQQNNFVVSFCDLSELCGEI